MRRARNQRIEAAATTASRLQWRVARRCDWDVAKAIAMGEELDGVYQLDYVGLFTGFLAYLRLIGLWAALVALKAEGRQRFNACQVKEGVCRRGQDRRKNKEASGRPIGVDAMNRHFCGIAAKAVGVMPTPGA